MGDETKASRHFQSAVGLRVILALDRIYWASLLDISFSYRRHVRRMQGTSQYETSKANGAVSRQKLQTFAIVLTIAYFLVLIRCIYRIPELAGGWGNHLMRIEKEFLVLDGTMIALATLILTAFWP
ncbi:parasitic phase-specific PSP-1 [Fusarium agapanthi]|uniref:Parasitic phase-specific PSP-1 n=1 Tax=Fusarium agapanthi TaxID=1803897 RepID=A0A9P5B721_9HYPO|nr:parasitic phase-specific PSP-1 [Fusarium agapanthi]